MSTRWFAKKDETVLGFIAVATLLLTIVEVTEAGKVNSGSLVFDGKLYHYDVNCRNDIIGFNDLKFKYKVCEADHPTEKDEWFYASVPSKEAHDLLASLTEEAIWLGGERKNAGSLYKWDWPGEKKKESINFASISYSTSGIATGNCSEGKYCNFVDGALTTIDVICGGNVQRETSQLMILSKTEATSKGRQWAAVPGELCQNPSVPTAKCYACQKVEKAPPTTTEKTTATTTTQELMTTTKFSPPMTSIIVSSTTTEIPSSTATTTEAGLFTTITAKEPVPSSTITTTFFPETKDSENKKSKTPGIVLGSIIGAVVLIGLILLVVFLIRKKSNKGKVISIV